MSILPMTDEDRDKVIDEADAVLARHLGPVHPSRLALHRLRNRERRPNPSHIKTTGDLIDYLMELPPDTPVGTQERRDLVITRHALPNKQAAYLEFS